MGKYLKTTKLPGYLGTLGCSWHYHVVYVIIIVRINLVKSNEMAWERYQDHHSLAH